MRCWKGFLDIIQLNSFIEGRQLILFIQQLKSWFNCLHELFSLWCLGLKKLSRQTALSQVVTKTLMWQHQTPYCCFCHQFLCLYLEDCDQYVPPLNSVILWLWRSGTLFGCTDKRMVSQIIWTVFLRFWIQTFFLLLDQLPCQG